MSLGKISRPIVTACRVKQLRGSIVSNVASPVALHSQGVLPCSMMKVHQHFPQFTFKLPEGK